jgi:DNA-binding NarL/FixJ family response regulator
MIKSNRTSIRVLVVEPNAIDRNGLTHVLDADRRFTVVRAARSIHDAQAERLQPDLIVVDPAVGRCTQPDILVELAAAAPNACICVRTSAIDLGTTLDVMHDHRVNACILKNGHVDEHLLDVLHLAVHAGCACVDGVLMEQFRTDAEGRLVCQPHPSADCYLPPRELEVLCLLVDGMRSKEIACHLNIAESTVESHIDRARKKLRARNNEQLVAIAMRHGLLS